MNALYASEMVAAVGSGRRDRRATLKRLGRQGRLAAYRRGELDFETCCLWAARWPHEVPLLEGEFEFIARTMPEVCE